MTTPKSERKKSVTEILAEVQAFFAQVPRGEKSWTDELIEERREEAKRDFEEDNKE